MILGVGLWFTIYPDYFKNKEIKKGEQNIIQSIGLNNKTILVTGAAGFIDANLVLKLLEKYDEPT